MQLCKYICKKYLKNAYNKTHRRTHVGSRDPPDPQEPIPQPVKTPTPVVGHGFLQVGVQV